MAESTAAQQPAAPSFTPFTATTSSHGITTAVILQLDTSSQPPQHASTLSLPTDASPTLLRRRRCSTISKRDFRFSVSQRRRASSINIDPISSAPRKGSTASPSPSPSTSELDLSPPSSPTTARYTTPNTSRSTSVPRLPSIRQWASLELPSPSDLVSSCYVFKSVSQEDLASTMPSLPFAFGKSYLPGSRRGHNLGSASSSIPTTPSPRQSTFEAHPGTRVDFSSFSETNTYGQWKKEEDMEERLPDDEYHRFLRGVGKEKSDKRKAQPDSLQPPKHAQDEQRKPCFDNIDYKARKLAQRTRSEDRRDRIWRESLATKECAQRASRGALGPYTSTHVPSRSGSEGRQAVQRTGSSDSSSSTEVFVNRVRASFEYRSSEEFSKGRAGYNIFKDEVEEGYFLAENETIDSSRKGHRIGCRG